MDGMSAESLAPRTPSQVRGPDGPGGAPLPALKTILSPTTQVRPIPAPVGE